MTKREVVLDNKESEEALRYVYIGNPSGWTAVAKTIRDKDEDKVKDCKEDIDTLLVFTGLFSAVLTAFVIESYQNLSMDKMDTVIQFLGQISGQTNSYVSANGRINSTVPPVSQTQSAFIPSEDALRVNQLWFASLIVALITASFGILVKQWLREYLAVEYTSPHERLRARQFRHPGLAHWKVFEIAGVLPLLLQLSLGLFLLGLCFFTFSVNTGVGETSAVLVAGWALLFMCTIVAPILSPRCPYKTSYLKGVMAILRRQFGYRLRRQLEVVFPFLPHTDALEEEEAVQQKIDELQILLEVDAYLLDDDQLRTTIFESLMQVQPDPDKAIQFVIHALQNRLKGSITLSPLTDILDLRQLSKRGWIAVTSMVADTVTHGIETVNTLDSSAQWFDDGIRLLLSTSDYPLTVNARNALVRCVQKKTFDRFLETLKSLSATSVGTSGGSRLHCILEQLSARLIELLSCHQLSADQVIKFILHIVLLETGHLSATPLESILDFQPLSPSIWTFIQDTVGNIILDEFESPPPEDDIGPWLEDAIHILLSESGYPLTPTASRALACCIAVKPSYPRFGGCFRPLVAPSCTQYPHILVRVREMCGYVAEAHDVEWLLRQVANSPPCHSQCSHNRPRRAAPLPALIYDHFTDNQIWFSAFLPILADGLNLGKKHEMTGRSVLSSHALLSLPVPLRDIDAEAAKLLYRCLTSPQSSMGIMNGICNPQIRDELAPLPEVTIRSLVALLVDGDAPGQKAFITWQTVHCTIFLGDLKSPVWVNVVRFCWVMIQVHQKLQGRPDLYTAWQHFYIQCTKVLESYRENKYSQLRKKEKRDTRRLAKECLDMLPPLEPADFTPNTELMLETLLPDGIFQQLAKFISPDDDHEDDEDHEEDDESGDNSSNVDDKTSIALRNFAGIIEQKGFKDLFTDSIAQAELTL